MSKYEYKDGQIMRDGVLVKGYVIPHDIAEHSEWEGFMKDFTLLLNFADLLRRRPHFLDTLNKHYEIEELVEELI